MIGRRPSLLQRPERLVAAALTAVLLHGAVLAAWHSQPAPGARASGRSVIVRFIDGSSREAQDERASASADLRMQDDRATASADLQSQNDRATATADRRQTAAVTQAQRRALQAAAPAAARRGAAPIETPPTAVAAPIAPPSHADGGDLRIRVPELSLRDGPHRTEFIARVDSHGRVVAIDRVDPPLTPALADALKLALDETTFAARAEADDPDASLSIRVHAEFEAQEALTY